MIASMVTLLMMPITLVNQEVVDVWVEGDADVRG